MRSGSRLSWAAAAMVAVLALAAGTALGQVQTYDSKITISRAVPLYHGKVKAPTGKCMRGRKVVLFQKQPGADAKLGKDRTNRKGRWIVELPAADLAPQDRFYAKVRRKLNIVSGEGYQCRSARSRTVTFVGD